MSQDDQPNELESRSPDGKWIAFTGQYDGDEQVYVVPSGGGVPRQLTFYPAKGPFTPRWGWDNQVYGWTADGKRIIFSSNYTNPRGGNFDLYLISLDGSGLEKITSRPEFDGFPMFRRDGKFLIWASNRHGKTPNETNLFVAEWTR